MPPFSSQSALPLPRGWRTVTRSRGSGTRWTSTPPLGCVDNLESGPFSCRGDVTFSSQNRTARASGPWRGAGLSAPRRVYQP